MTDAASPSLTTRLRATLHREVSADMLEAYKRAGLAVYDALADAEEHRAAPGRRARGPVAGRFTEKVGAGPLTWWSEAACHGRTGGRQRRCALQGLGYLLTAEELLRVE